MAYEPVSSFWQVIGYWQTLIAGVLAVIAAIGAILATIWTAKREIAAAQEQVNTAQEQIDTTLRLERRRIAREAPSWLP